MIRRQTKGWRATAGRAAAVLLNVWFFLGTPSGLVMGTLVAVYLGVASWSRAIILSPITEAAAGTFLFLLWSIVGISYLVDRRKPRQIQTHHDYRYGLTFEGVVMNFVPANSEMPDPGSLVFVVNIRNFSPGPIKYVLEDYAIQFGTRSAVKYDRNTVVGYMARGAGRSSSGSGFPAGSMAEFYGKGLTQGSGDISICYGPPEGPLLRRLRLSLEMNVVLPKDGIPGPQNPLAYGDKILSETDEPINSHE